MNIISIVLLTGLFSVSVFAQKSGSKELMSCNPPMGSGLQEVRITQVGNKIYRSELPSSPATFTEQVDITSDWKKKDLTWTSRSGGAINLKLEPYGNNSYWFYRSAHSIGYCRETPVR